MLLITEFSNNSADVSPHDKGAQYADYIQLLRTEPNLGAAFGFALNWPGRIATKKAGKAAPSRARSWPARAAWARSCKVHSHLLS